MATNVQVVLKEDIDTLGLQGELVKVRAGYARNYLIPRGLAAMATRSNISQIEHERRLAMARAEKERSEAEQIAKQLEGLHVQVAKEAGDEGKLYGSVTSQDVFDALERKDVKIDKKKLVMPDEAIKRTGDYEFQVKLQAGVRATVPLRVVTKA